jgi:PD-(D/E)XK nuclease superfamily
MNKTKEEIEQIAEQVVDAMLKVHRSVGPGQRESTYQACLAHELGCRGIEVYGWSTGYKRLRRLSWRSSRLRGATLSEHRPIQTLAV